MKRDLDLLRGQLLQIERLADGNDCDLELDKGSTGPLEFNEHLRCLHEAGYITAHKVPDDAEDYYHYVPVRLTNSGHDFLDSIRDQSIWDKTKSGVAAVGGAALPVVFDMALNYGKLKLKEKTGIDLP
jgi:hypothetical protein